MRKPPPAAKSSGKKLPAEPEPPGGRALQRTRQFALQRGLPAPNSSAAETKPAAGRKTSARKKQP